MRTIDEAIKHCEEVAYEQDMKAGFETDNQTYTMSEAERERCKECAKEHRQLAEWLRELKESRMVLDILGQFLVDTDIDVCCEDLTMMDDYCEKYCDNQNPLCWYRWAKMKAGEVNTDEDSD